MLGESVGYLTGLGATIALIAALRPLAGRMGLVDRPRARKPEATRVPLVGGLAMFFGFALGALAMDLALGPLRALFAASAVLVAVGVLDDLRELKPLARFAVQIAAALLMVYWGGVRLVDLGALRAGGEVFELGAFEVALTLFAVVGVINTVNMADGADGLAGGLTVVALLGLAYLAHGAGDETEFRILVLLAVVAAGFLAFNVRLPGRPQALVFMGDAGSMFLGFALAWFFIRLSQGEPRVMPPVAALWLLLVPLYDTVWLIVRRLSRGRSPTWADREHLHHVLQMTGLSPGTAVLVIWMIAAVAAVGGLHALAQGASERFMFHLFLALFAGYCALMALAWRANRLLVWPLDRRLTPVERRQLRNRRQGERRSESERRADGDRRA
jgi:UDP-GlcNAc:undecaprenyl-phosphate GlcNAc-1-phosphate transferase